MKRFDMNGYFIWAFFFIAVITADAEAEFSMVRWMTNLDQSSPFYTNKFLIGFHKLCGTARDTVVEATENRKIWQCIVRPLESPFDAVN